MLKFPVGDTFFKSSGSHKNGEELEEQAETDSWIELARLWAPTMRQSTTVVIVT